MTAQSMSDDIRPEADSSFRSIMLAFAAVLAATLFLLIGVSVVGSTKDGEPLVNLDIHLIQRSSSVVPGRLYQANPSRDVSASSGAASQNASSLGKIDKPIYAGQNLIADPALIEPTSEGPLPRIADDGRTPMQAYAPAAKVDARPKIVLVVTGLGESAGVTAAAIKALPPQITFAFVPFAEDVQRWISAARASGHEALLEVPMEPYDFPDSDPGPHTLTVTASEQSNIERLTWTLTRATGYSGVTNLLGGRFMTAPESLAPVITFLGRRGLLFFDADQQGGSAGPDIAKQANAPYLGSALAIDDIPSATEIDARLSQLEARARAGGIAAGVGFVYPVSIDRLAQWASGLAGRGFVLVPPSVIVRRSN